MQLVPPWRTLTLRQKYLILYNLVIELEPEATVQTVRKSYLALHPDVNIFWIPTALKRLQLAGILQYNSIPVVSGHKIKNYRITGKQM